MLEEIHGNRVSVTTVKDRLAAANLRGHVAKKKPLLKPRHLQQRLEFARNYINYSVEDWERVLWTDESKFCLFRNDGRVYVRRRPWEAYSSQCIVPTVRHGGGNVLVWAGFSASGPGIISQVKGIMDRFVYLDILQNCMIPSAHFLIGEDFTLMQDNDPKHTANVVKTWLQDPYPHTPFVTLKWPPQSPDLNPIENLWDHVGREVSRVNVPRLSELYQSIEEIWNNIPTELCKRYVHTMPSRLREVIANRGGHTHY